MARDTKNGDDRVVTLPDPAVNELRKFREIGDGLVFASPNNPHRPMAFRKYWDQAVEKAGVTNFRGYLSEVPR